MRLTDQQLGFFDTFGYLGFPGLFDDKIEAITHSFEQVWAEHGGGRNNLRRGDPPADVHVEL